MFLVGCNIRQGFQPLPDNYEIYQKNGLGEIEVRKALLECGMEDPIGYLKLDTGKNDKEKVESMVYAEMCMFNDGFTRKNFKSICSQSPHFEACKPENAQFIPKRSVERRLSSAYCKTYPRADACQRRD